MNNYLPELRESLVEAARRGAVPSESIPQPRSNRWRSPPLGTVGVGLASMAAIAVMVIALTVAGHRGARNATGQAQPSIGSSSRLAVLRTAAGHVLDGFVVPHGAVRSPVDPSRAASLGNPNDMLSLPLVAAVHRFWRLPGRVDEVGQWIARHPPAGGELRATQELVSGPSRGSAGHRKRTVGMWGGFFVYSSTPPGTTMAELAVQIAPARDGGVAVRADGEAGWMAPRPVAQQIPAGITRIVGTNTATRAHQRRGSSPGASGQTGSAASQITSRAQIRRAVTLLNLLRPAHRVPRGCQRAPLVRTALSFYAAGRRAPIATATVDFDCRTLTLAIANRPAQTLAIDLPGLDGSLISDLSGPLKAPLR